jgi:E3 ubiquitin-protein ligase DOA10
LPPHGFKTLEERILEDKRKIVEEMENRVRELQELEERERQADIETRFREMMGEETGELYRACLNNIPSLFRDSDRSGPGFKTAMKQAFIKIPNN